MAPRHEHRLFRGSGDERLFQAQPIIKGLSQSWDAKRAELVLRRHGGKLDLLPARKNSGAEFAITLPL
jgi:hypothetical protein